MFPPSFNLILGIAGCDPGVVAWLLPCSCSEVDLPGDTVGVPILIVSFPRLGVEGVPLGALLRSFSLSFSLSLSLDFFLLLCFRS